MSNTEYSKGYNAGRKRSERDAKEIEILKEKINERDERIYLSCLELALKHCHNWTIGDKK